jgi:hypothetical protein
MKSKRRKKSLLHTQNSSPSIRPVRRTVSNAVRALSASLCDGPEVAEVTEESALEEGPGSDEAASSRMGTRAL